jgi:hypothetical protein
LQTKIYQIRTRVNKWFKKQGKNKKKHQKQNKQNKKKIKKIKKLFYESKREQVILLNIMHVTNAV